MCRVRWQRTTAIALVCAGALMVSGLFAPAARADLDTWACGNYFSGQTCYAGTGYRSYIEVVNAMGVFKYEVCAKGVTAAGNRRTGSGCSNNAKVRISCFDGISPYSAAYIYWGGGGDPATVFGEAKTPSSRQYC